MPSRFDAAAAAVIAEVAALSFAVPLENTVSCNTFLDSEDDDLLAFFFLRL